MTIYWLPSNGAIIQCGRKAHALKAGRTSRVQHPKCGRSIKLGTLRSHDCVPSKSDQHFSQEQIKTTFMGTFSINPAFAHWAHWSHLLSVLPMYPACAWWVFGSLSPMAGGKGSSASQHKTEREEKNGGVRRTCNDGDRVRRVITKEGHETRRGGTADPAAPHG